MKLHRHPTGRRLLVWLAFGLYFGSIWPTVAHVLALVLIAWLLLDDLWRWWTARRAK